MAPADLCPSVRRRRLLRSVGAVAAAGLAGCLGAGESPDGGSEPRTTDDWTPTPIPPEVEPPTTFTTASSRCGNQVNRADVTVDHRTVTVEGTTWGREACYVARLDSATLDDGTLTVRVVTERAADPDESCAQCIAEIEYRAVVEPSDRPAEVVVVHDGETVATVSIT